MFHVMFDLLLIVVKFLSSSDRVSAKFEFRYESLKSKFSLFFLSTIWWLATLKRLEKIVRENAFDDQKNRPGLKLI